MNKKPIRTKICLNCNKEFIIYKSKFNRKFCSYKCYTLFPKSDSFKRKISDYIKNHPIKNHPKGKEIYNYTKIEKKCIVCKKPFLVSPSHKDRNHCSRKCYFFLTNKENKKGEKSYNWRGGFCDYHGSGWHKIRREVYKRDNYTCRLCGKNKFKDKVRIVAHHSIPRILFPSDCLANLYTLCSKCHGKTEREYSKIIKQKCTPVMFYVNWKL